MNQMSQYFEKNPKKRDLSNGSKIGDDDFKKAREGSSGSYTDEADIFEVLSQLTAGKFYLTV